MKKINCYDCDLVFKAETKDDILNQLYRHYMKDHYERITSANESEKKVWMERFEHDWVSASSNE